MGYALDVESSGGSGRQGEACGAELEEERRSFIPKSKTDQQAKGAWRTLQCCGDKQCDVLCPWNLAVTA